MSDKDKMVTLIKAAYQAGYEDRQAEYSFDPLSNEVVDAAIEKAMEILDDCYFEMMDARGEL